MKLVTAHPPTPASLSAEPRLAGPEHAPPDVESVASEDNPNASSEAPTADNSFGGWGTSDWCIGVSDDVQPPTCSDPTGCYKLQLSDLHISVVSVMGKGLPLEDANRHYQAIDSTTKERRIKACFAHELARGRPPTGLLRIDLTGNAGECAVDDAKIVEKNVGVKTAECVRDALQRYRLPSAVSSSQKAVTVGIEIAVEGISP